MQQRPHSHIRDVLTFARRYKTALAALALCAVFAAESLAFISTNSLCNDETKHLATGRAFLQSGRCCLGVDNSPSTAWFALPGLVDDLPPGLTFKQGMDAHRAGHRQLFGSRDPIRRLARARHMGTLAGLLLLLCVVLATRVGTKHPGWLLGLALVALEPNILAHFSLVSTDSMLALGVTFLTFALLWQCETGHLRAAALAGLGLGLSILAKLSGLSMLAAPLLALLLHRHPSTLRRRLVSLSLTYAIALLTLWLGYGAHLTTTAPFVALPGFSEGLLAALKLSREGVISYFLGEVGFGWHSYFLVTLLIKTAEPVLALWLFVAVMRFKKKNWRPDLNDLPLLLAVGLMVINIQSNLDIGVRHLLAIFPLMAIWVGRYFELLRAKQRHIAIVFALVLALLLESLAATPRQIGYFNALTRLSGVGWQIVADSNVDWGQDLGRLKVWMQKNDVEEIALAYAGNVNPAFYGIRFQQVPVMFYGKRDSSPLKGPRSIVVASVNHLNGILYGLLYGDPRYLYFLRGRPPMARIGDSLFAYDITGDVEAHRLLARLYMRAGETELARSTLIRGSVAAQHHP